MAKQEYIRSWNTRLRDAVSADDIIADMTKTFLDAKKMKTALSLIISIRGENRLRSIQDCRTADVRGPNDSRNTHVRSLLTIHMD